MTTRRRGPVWQYVIELGRDKDGRRRQIRRSGFKTKREAEALGAVDDIDKVLKIGQVKGEIDEKMFTETKATIKSNIYSAANNVPEQLVKSETSLFGTQSETYIEMKKFYTEQTFEERNELEKTLKMLGFECKIIPIVDITPITIQTNEPPTPSI